MQGLSVASGKGRVGAQQEEDFETGRYKWTLARGFSHGFTHASPGRKKGAWKREDIARGIYEEAYEWLGIDWPH